MIFRKMTLFILLILFVLSSCSTPATAVKLDVTNSPVAATLTPPPPTETPLPSATFTQEPSQTPTETATPAASETASPVPSATSTLTFGEAMRTRIIFYLLIPEPKRTDACGAITEVPIISKRMLTGDKLQDVQIALNMLFSIGRKYYGPYYNALWNTKFVIKEWDYNPKKDYMTITFGGYFPFTTLDPCDKHGIRQQIWTTFFHYGFKEKTFKYYEKFLIDRLGGN
ncbi:MAG: hypothetical protein WCK35_15175 [Chloroflexota bacterium]